MKLEKEESLCLAYFQSSKVWERLLEGFQKKYRSFGSFTGTVTLGKLTSEERKTLEGFFGENFHGQKSISISAKRFEKALAASRYADISPQRLLYLFFGEVPQGKKEIQAVFQQRKQEILETVAREFADTWALELLPELLTTVKPETSGDVSALPPKRQQEILAQWQETLQLAMRIAVSLPYHESQSMYLAVFAAKMTGNPHAFDAGSSGGKLLYQVVKTDLAKRQIQIDDKIILRSYQRQRSYLAVGLLIDDVSNYAMLYNVQSLQKDGEKHPGMAGFCEEKDMVQVPLSVMMKWEKMQCPDQRILIVENPSVFATLCADDDGSHAYMCMNGQPRLAALVAMDLLAVGGTAVSYAGDLDPEGLLIGQKLAEYYPGEFQFVYMAAEDYKQSMSNEMVSDRRIKILDRINHPQLLDTVAAIRKYRRAGYQELVDLRERET